MLSEREARARKDKVLYFFFFFFVLLPWRATRTRVCLVRGLSEKCKKITPGVILIWLCHESR